MGRACDAPPGELILIAGPYRSGTGDVPERMAANVRLMETYALPLFRAGHTPLLGEWLALPLAHLAVQRDLPSHRRARVVALRRCPACRRCVARA